MGATNHGNTYLKVFRCLTRTASGKVAVNACKTKISTQQWARQQRTLRNLATGTCLLATATPKTGSCTAASARNWRVTSSQQLASGGRCLSQDDFILHNPKLRFIACDVTSPSQRWFIAKNIRGQARRLHR